MTSRFNMKPITDSSHLASHPKFYDFTTFNQLIIPMKNSILQATGKALLISLLVIFTGCEPKTDQKPASQNPSPMVETIRPHHRVKATECEGRREEWTYQDKKAQLFVPTAKDSTSDKDLIIHFHGAASTVEVAVCDDPNKVMLTITGGSGSSSYGRLFDDPKEFTSLLEEVYDQLKIDKVASITLTGWSAGYGAIRAILRHHEVLIDQVILLDGLHASYIPERKVLYEGGKIDSTQLAPFIEFSKKSIQGEKGFLMTHSSIFPGTYASTTECSEYMIHALGLSRTSVLKAGPVGMQQVGEVSKGNFRLLSYAGNTAPDHIDHLHGLGFFLKLLFSDR